MLLRNVAKTINTKIATATTVCRQTTLRQSSQQMMIAAASSKKAFSTVAANTIHITFVDQEVRK